MLDRQVAPSVQPLASVTLPAADVFSLLNGARLHVLRNAAQPVVRLQVVFPAGKWYDPKSGVSLLTARMLLEGTRTRNARQIADEIAFYGASLECEQGFDRSTLTLYCLARHFRQLLPLVVAVITEPTFPATELDLLKTRTVQNVQIERQKPGYLASERFSNNLFGPTFPYGSVFNEATFQNITAGEVKAFHQATYQLSSAEVFLCGDVGIEQEELVTRMIGQHSSTNLPLVIEQADLRSAPLQDHVLLPDSIQSSLRIGRLWPSLSHADTHSLQVLVKVLGGYFGSRLMKNIREDKGYTYGIYASVSAREYATSFVIGTDVNAESTKSAIHEIHHELHRLQKELIPADELQTVKNYMAGKFANELSTVFEQCDKYKNLIFQHLPNTYYSDFLSQIRSVTSETLLQLSQDYLSPTDMIEVVAGPAH
ncbi:pitrilysin family protein [Hymenobacter sp. GOD-10R]|uniref:M16 family metallopeptidase n=1 Tax=Hymenobacter sp. GOD-10R TaxID=3093922 RepID=UPI002D7962FC|nr:pitrilysin family protein [Hymenobacter sp. GOD-10R]WRQ28077.1 pitrilysin family protein [Hymenobacter sp. GOD-10R]